MDRFVTWLKAEWREFYIDPVDYGFKRGLQLIMMALGIFIFLAFAQCAGGIVYLGISP